MSASWQKLQPGQPRPEAEAKAEATAREQAERDRIARVVADEAERKAERDRRYAARKARQR